MNRKWCSAIIAAIMGLSLAIGCNEDAGPANPPASEPFFGKWVGSGFNEMSTPYGPQCDTMQVSLKIDERSYSMQRDFWGKAGSGGGTTTDTVIEEGTWSKIGADSLLLTPAAGKCIRWNMDEAKMMPGIPNPPVRIRIAITDSACTDTTWNMNMQNLKDPDTTTAVILKKQ